MDEGAEGVEDEGRMRDLAYLSMARTYYSSSIKLDAETNAPNVNSEKLSAAVKYWNQVDEGSEYWLDALFEESWAYFMAGDYPRALGNVHTIQAPYFPGSFYPEAEHSEGRHLLLELFNYEAATTVVARFNKKYVPLRKELAKVLAHFKSGAPEDSYKFLLTVRDGTADLDPSIKGIVTNAMSDRQLLRNIEYVKVLDAELDHFKKSPSSFQTSGLGVQVQDALKFARATAVQNAGKLAKSRYDREPGRSRRASPERRENSDRYHRCPKKPARREASAGSGQQGRVEDLRRREARRRTPFVAVPRRVLARRARVLPTGCRVCVWEIIKDER